MAEARHRVGASGAEGMLRLLAWGIFWVTYSMLEGDATGLLLIAAAGAFSVADLRDPATVSLDLETVFVVPIALASGVWWALLALAVASLSRTVGSVRHRAARAGAIAAHAAGALTLLTLDGGHFLSESSEAGEAVLTSACFFAAAAVGQLLWSHGSTQRWRMGQESLQLSVAKASVAALCTLMLNQSLILAIVVILLLLLLVRQAYAMLWRTRRTYEAATETLVETIEAGDGSMQGHARGAFQRATSIAQLAGMDARSIERVGYATLLHDFDAFASAGGTSGLASLGDVRFLEGALRVLRVRADGSSIQHSQESIRDAFVVALAANADSKTERRRHVEIDDFSAKGQYRGLNHADKARVLSATVALGYSVPGVD